MITAPRNPGHGLVQSCVLGDILSGLPPAWDLTNTNRGVLFKSHISQGSSARRLVIEATYSL
jgi:hypothetical protein